MRVLSYARCSSVEQSTEGWSIEAQQARIRAWATANDALLLEEVADIGVSGSKPLSQRAGGATIAKLLDARKPGIEAVVVVRLDRLGRDAAESLSLFKKFRTGTVGLVALAEQIDLATPHGRALAGVSAVFSELERSLIGQRTKETLAQLRQQGRPWNHAPFGWVARNGLLEPEPTEQLALDVMRGLRSAGASYRAIAIALRSGGVATKRGGRWEAATVRSVLRSQPQMDKTAALSA